MALMAGKDSSGIPRSIIIDDKTRFIVSLSGSEHHTHKGEQFFAQYQQSVTNINNISAMVFSTPLASLSTFIHMIVEGHSTDQVEFRLIETPSVDEGEGTSVIVPYNRFRDSTITSLLRDAEPVKATGGVLEWTGVGEEGDEFSIGDDVYLVAASEATATAAGKIWVDLGNGLADTMVTNAVAAIDAAQATSANAETVEATDGTGSTIDLDADGYGIDGNLAVTVIVGANMAAGVSLTGGLGVTNDGGDTEVAGVVNSISAFDLTDAAAANITTTISLINEIIGQAADTPAHDAQQGMSRGAREWILKQGTQYCVYMKSLNANDNIHTIDLHWMEMTHLDPTND